MQSCSKRFSAMVQIRKCPIYLCIWFRWTPMSLCNWYDLPATETVVRTPPWQRHQERHGTLHKPALLSVEQKSCHPFRPAWFGSSVHFPEMYFPPPITSLARQWIRPPRHGLETLLAYRTIQSACSIACKFSPQIPIISNASSVAP